MKLNNYLPVAEYYCHLYILPSKKNKNTIEDKLRFNFYSNMRIYYGSGYNFRFFQ